MSVAPRIAERLLEALCPPSPFRDGVLGDLSEEYLRKRSTHGRLAARSWYYAQALVSAPHLVAHWAARVTLGAWIGVAAFGLGAMAASRAAIIVAQMAALVALGWGIPDSLGVANAAWRDMYEAYPHMTQLIMCVPWLVAALAGYLIGRFRREAPVAAAGTTAVTASVIAVAVLSSEGKPLMFALWLDLAVWSCCMVAGGAIAALTRREPSNHYQFD